MIALRAAELLADHVQTTIVTTHDDEPPHPTLDQALSRAGDEDIFLVTWGPHVGQLLPRLEGRRVVYYAQSQGWKIDLPPAVPVLALSQHLLGYWAEHAPTNLLLRLPPVLDDLCVDPGRERSVDVLVHDRKCTTYLREQLVPALQDRCNVKVIKDFISRAELIEEYQTARTYLYSSKPWDNWVEGFGLQPLEARACGATVFTNLHGGLSDHQDPQMESFKIEVHSLQYDVHRVLSAVDGSLSPMADPAAIARIYSKDAFHHRVSRLLPALQDFFDHCQHHPSDIPHPAPTPPSPTILTRARHLVRRRLSRS